MNNSSITTRVTRTIMITGTIFILIIYISLYFINIEKSNNFHKNNLTNIIGIVSNNFNENVINKIIENDNFIKEIIFNNKTYKGKSFNQDIAFKKNFFINGKDLEIIYGDSSQNAYVNALKIRMGIVAFGFYLLVYLISLNIRKVLSPFEDIVLFFKEAKIDNMKNLDYQNNNVAKEFDYVKIEINSIVSKLNEYTKKINYLAYKDELTELSNRRSYYKDIKEIVLNAKYDIYLMFLDLDGFKDINDKHGHKIGDLVLKEVAKRLSLFEDISNVYRVGGDEFIIIIESENVDKIIDLANDLISTVSKDIYKNNEILTISTSIGIAQIKPNEIDKIDCLLKESDIAMYEAKKSGKNQFKFITKDLIKKIEDKDKLLKDLKIAAENEEFTFVIQPQVNSINNEIIGGEALIRWKKNGELLSPFFFINELEDSVFIIPVSNQIITKIFEFTKFLKEKKKFKGRIAINLAEKHINDKNFILYIINILEKTKCKPEYIEFEITERWKIIDSEIIKKHLKSLKDLGFYISIDDFGEDNSSFKRTDILPIDKIKLDKNFSDRIFEERSSLSSIESTYHYSKLTNREFIIEGIEKKEQVEELKKMNIYNIQGFYFYKPLKKEDFLAILNK